MDHHADINARMEYGETPLFYVIADRDPNDEKPDESVRWFLQHGARVSIKNREGQTAIDYARETEKTSLIPLLKAALRKERERQP